jgi:hypothetical protein
MPRRTELIAYYTFLKFKIAISGLFICYYFYFIPFNFPTGTLHSGTGCGCQHLNRSGGDPKLMARFFWDMSFTLKWLGKKQSMTGKISSS